MFRKGEPEYIKNQLLNTPPIDCDFKVGDIVTYTNDYGVSFEGRKIIGFSKPEDMLGTRGCIHRSAPRTVRDTCYLSPGFWQLSYPLESAWRKMQKP